MKCKNCGEEMELTYRYIAKEFLESDEEEYTCPHCGATVLFYENWESWEGVEEDEEYNDGYFEEVGMQVSDLVERR